MPGAYQAAIAKRLYIWICVNFISFMFVVFPMAYAVRSYRSSFNMLYVLYASALMFAAATLFYSLHFLADKAKFGATSLKYPSGANKKTWKAAALGGFIFWQAFYFLFEGDVWVHEWFALSNFLPVLGCIVSLHISLKAAPKPVLKPALSGLFDEYVQGFKLALSTACRLAALVGALCTVALLLLKMVLFGASLVGLAASNSGAGASASRGIISVVGSALWPGVLAITSHDLWYVCYASAMSSGIAVFTVTMQQSTLVSLLYCPVDFTKLGPISSAAAAGRTVPVKGLWMRSLNPKITALEDPTVRFLSVGLNLDSIYNAIVVQTSAASTARALANRDLNWKTVLRQQLESSDFNLNVNNCSKAHGYDPSCVNYFGENKRKGTMPYKATVGAGPGTVGGAVPHSLSPKDLLARCMAAQDLNRLLRSPDTRRRREIMADKWNCSVVMLSTNLCIDAVAKQLKLLEKFMQVVMNVSDPPAAATFDKSHDVSEAVNINRLQGFVADVSTRPSHRPYNVGNHSTGSVAGGSSNGMGSSTTSGMLGTGNAAASGAENSSVAGPPGSSWLNWLALGAEESRYSSHHLSMKSAREQQQALSLERHRPHSLSPAAVFFGPSASIPVRVYRGAAFVWRKAQAAYSVLIPDAAPRWLANQRDKLSALLTGTLEEKNRRRLRARLAYADKIVEPMWAQWVVHTVENSALILQCALNEDVKGHCKAFAFSSLQSLKGLQTALLSYATLVQQAQISEHGILSSGTIGSLQSDRFGAGGVRTNTPAGHRLQHMMRKSMKHASLSPELQSVALAVDDAIANIEGAYGDLLQLQTLEFEQHRITR